MTNRLKMPLLAKFEVGTFLRISKFKRLTLFEGMAWPVHYNLSIHSGGFMVAMYAETLFNAVVDWETVMKENEKRLHSFIRKRVNNFADVDDLFQTTWLEVLVNKARYKGNSRPESWVFGIAMNLVKIYYKDSRIRAVTAAPEEALEQESKITDEPEIILEGRERLMLAIQKFSTMPVEYQKLLKVLVENDVGYQELADSLAIPIGTVRSRLSRLRAFLKKELKWEG